MNQEHISKALTDDEIAVLRELLAADAKRDRKAIGDREQVTLQPDD